MISWRSSGRRRLLGQPPATGANSSSESPGWRVASVRPSLIDRDVRSIVLPKYSQLVINRLRIPCCYRAPDPRYSEANYCSVWLWRFKRRRW